MREYIQYVSHLNGKGEQFLMVHVTMPVLAFILKRKACTLIIATCNTVFSPQILDTILCTKSRWKVNSISRECLSVPGRTQTPFCVESKAANEGKYGHIECETHFLPSLPSKNSRGSSNGRYSSGWCPVPCQAISSGDRNGDKKLPLFPQRSRGLLTLVMWCPLGFPKLQ